MNTIIKIKATDAQRMTSLEIARLTGKPHNDVMKAIRAMEPGWQKACKGKFSLTSREVKMPNGGKREEPYYSLTKTECLYVATKFNDEARAKLVLRWEKLEKERLTTGGGMTDKEIISRAVLISQELIRRQNRLRENFNRLITLM